MPLSVLRGRARCGCCDAHTRSRVPRGQRAMQKFYYCRTFLFHPCLCSFAASAPVGNSIAFRADTPLCRRDRPLEHTPIRATAEWEHSLWRNAARPPRSATRRVITRLRPSCVPAELDILLACSSVAFGDLFSLRASSHDGNERDFPRRRVVARKAIKSVGRLHGYPSSSCAASLRS